MKRASMSMSLCAPLLSLSLLCFVEHAGAVSGGDQTIPVLLNLSAQMERAFAKLNEITTEITSLKSEIKQDMKAVETRLTAMEERLTAMEERLTAVEERLMDEVDFGPRRVERLKHCVIKLTTCQKRLSLTLIRRGDQMAIVTAKHNLHYIVIGNHPYTFLKRFQRWQVLPGIDVAATNCSDIEINSTGLNPCTVDKATFQLAERVLAYCPGAVPPVATGSIVDVEADGSLLINTPAAPGSSGCAFSNHALLGVIQKEVVVERPEGHKMTLASVVPMAQVLDVVTNGTLLVTDFCTA